MSDTMTMHVTVRDATLLIREQDERIAALLELLESERERRREAEAAVERALAGWRRYLDANSRILGAARTQSMRQATGI